MASSSLVRSFRNSLSLLASAAIPRLGLDARDTGHALRFRQDMPGLHKRDLKVWIEHDTLFIHADWWADKEEEIEGEAYKGSIDLRVFGTLRTKEIKAELKNGVLKILIPRVKTTKPRVLEKDACHGADRKSWNVRETRKALHFRVDLPGLVKEDVKVFVEDNNLVVIGEWPYDEEEEVCWKPYTQKIDLSLTGDEYNKDEIQVEMENGVLKVVLPKVAG